jgi:hypothetical protein
VLNYQTVASFGPGAATATATSTSITFTQAFDELFASVMGQLLTATGFSPAGYNVTNAIITGNTEFTVTVAVSANPGPMTVSGQISAVEVVTDDYVATVTAVPAPSITPGSTEITLHFTDTNGTHDVVVPVNSSTGTTQVAQPAPTFAFPNRMSAATTYDLDMNVTGFLLTYSWAGSYSTPATRGTVAVSGVWEIVASDSYTSSYSAPDASSWSPILFAGPYMPTPAEVLAAWVAVYGDLPDSGSIKFQAFYIDPDTGTSGPALSATAGWEKGTLKGFSRSSWSGPLFGWSLLAQLTAITAPGSNVQTLALYGLNGYGGTINLSVKSGAVIYTGANSTKKALPSGYTATLSETSVTIPADSTTPVTFTLTQTAESGAQQFDGTVKVAATDGLSSTTSAFELNLSGDVVPQPPPDYLTISPLQSSPAAPSPGIVRLVFTLSNTGPDDIAVTMLSSFSNDSLSANFSDYTSVAATSDATTITFDLPNDGGTNGLIGLTLSSFGYAPDGFNVTDAVVVSNTPTSVTVASSANPGSMTTQGGVGFPNNGFTVAAGSLTTPTTYQTAIAITIPANLDTTGIQVQVEASAGNYTTYAAVRLT